MVRSSADKKRNRVDKDHDQDNSIPHEKHNGSKEMTLSRKIRNNLRDAQEQIVSKNVKRRRRNYRSSVEDADKETQYSVDSNQNSIACVKRSCKGQVKENKDHGAKSEPESLANLDSFQRELIVNGLCPGDKRMQIKGCNACGQKSRNMLHYFQQLSLGNRCRLQLRKSISRPVIDLISNLSLHRVASPFDRRVTALEWHPTRPNIVGVGSKGGDILLWDVDNVNSKEKFVSGAGAGGSCQAMKFWPWDLDRVVSASINGTVTLHDFEGRQSQILADTMNPYDHWFCSVDVNSNRYLVAAGRNHGIVRLMSTEGREVFECRLHKDKVTHLEFSPREDWLLCTASTDKTVQLWDIRMLKDRKSSLAVLKHERPINSAYFSSTDGCRLLTTDQHNEIRIYCSPTWHLERTDLHPHRIFRHISPYKATWHPLQDLIVVGRYPDKNFPGYQENELRTIDIIDADNGETVYQIHDPGADGLTPLNKFNRQGDALASGMGFHILLWNQKELIEAKQSAIKNGLMDFMSGSLPRSGSRSNQRSQPRNRGKEKKTKDTKTKDAKTKSETESKLTKVKLKTKNTKK